MKRYIYTVELSNQNIANIDKVIVSEAENGFIIEFVYYDYTFIISYYDAFRNTNEAIERMFYDNIEMFAPYDIIKIL